MSRGCEGEVHSIPEVSSFAVKKKEEREREKKETVME